MAENYIFKHRNKTEFSPKLAQIIFRLCWQRVIKIFLINQTKLGLSCTFFFFFRFSSSAIESMETHRIAYENVMKFATQIVDSLDIDHTKFRVFK